LASSVNTIRWAVHATIFFAVLIIVLLTFGISNFAGNQESAIDREALAKQAPGMTDKPFHKNFQSEDQCITCHTQQVLGAPLMAHEPRARCTECHQIKS
jgi:cytochrome c5